MASENNFEDCYAALLGLAENFRTSSPPNIRLCIHCLQSIFALNPPQKIEARTHLQLGNILLTHTKNTDLARDHLEKAWKASLSLANMDDVKFEAASTLANMYEKQPNIDMAKNLLRKGIELSQQSPFWHCRLLFQLSQIHATERDFVSACTLLGAGAEYSAGAKSDYTQLLFLLSKGMLLLINKQAVQVNETLSKAGSLIEQWTGPTVQKESLKVFFLVLQVCHYLTAGQVKSVKPPLKQLQQSIQTITQIHTDEDPVGTNQIDMFQWLPKEHMCVLVYLFREGRVSVCNRPRTRQPAEVVTPLMEANVKTFVNKIHRVTLEEVANKFSIGKASAHKIFHKHLGISKVTVMHSMQAGFMDKAQKYTDKALMQIEKLKMLDAHPLLSSFQLMLLEHIVMCRLIMGNKTTAIQEIFQACHVCQSQPRLFTTHGSQIHTLLGLYAMSMNCTEAAEAQFTKAIQLSDCLELTLFIKLNLAMVYSRMGRHQDLLGLLEQIDPEKLNSSSHSLKASAFYVQGLQAFFQAQYNDAKRYLRETLKMANAEDLNRLTSCSLVLLGHIFLSLGNSRESLNMVTPAMQLAGKIPDVHVQLWASSLLKDLYRLMGDRANEEEGRELHTSFSQSLLKDHFQSSQLSEHGLIQWTEGPCPFHLNTSGASDIYHGIKPFDNQQ